MNEPDLGACRIRYCHRRRLRARLRLRAELAVFRVRRDARRREDVSRQCQRDVVDARDPAESGRLGAAELHHRRHGGDRGARKPGGQRRRRAVRKGIDEVRQGAGVRRRAARTEPAEGLAGARVAVGSERVRRAVEDHGAPRIDVRQGQVVRRPRETGRLQEHRRRDAHSRRPRRGKSAAGGVGRLAHHRAADAQGLPALRRAVEQRREGTRLRRHRRDVAQQVRHAARRVHEGAGSAVGPGPAALPEAPCVRAAEAAREVRRRGAGQRPDSGASARQHLGAGVDEHLSAGRAAARPTPASRSPTS